MTVRSIPARRAPATAGAFFPTPVPRTGAVHLLTPPLDGRIRQRDGRIRGVPIGREGSSPGVPATFDGRIRGLLAACAGRLRPALTS